MEKPTVSLAQLSDSDRQELLFAHEKEMFKLKMQGAALAAVLFVFVGAFVVSVFKPGFEVSGWIAAASAGAIGTVVAGLGVQFGVTKARLKK